MPVSVKKLDGGYQVRTPKMIHAKKTSFEKATSQKRLLNAVEHSNWRPTGGAGSRDTRYKATQRSKGSRRIGDALESGGY